MAAPNRCPPPRPAAPDPWTPQASVPLGLSEGGYGGTMKFPEDIARWPHSAMRCYWPSMTYSLVYSKCTLTALTGLPGRSRLQCISVVEVDLLRTIQWDCTSHRPAKITRTKSIERCPCFLSCRNCSIAVVKTPWSKLSTAVREQHWRCLCHPEHIHPVHTRSTRSRAGRESWSSHHRRAPPHPTSRWCRSSAAEVEK